MAILIKRYANRKMYNTETSRYITLKGIAALIEEGKEVRVIDKETGEDITSVALSQILVDSERSNTTIPNSLFSQLIGRGGDALYDTPAPRSKRRERWSHRTPGTRAPRHEGRGTRAEKDPRLDPGPQSESDRIVQNAVERVFKVLDLPRKTDIEHLNRNLEQIAKAVQKLEAASKESAKDD